MILQGGSGISGTQIRGLASLRLNGYCDCYYAKTHTTERFNVVSLQCLRRFRCFSFCSVRWWVISSSMLPATSTSSCQLLGKLLSLLFKIAFFIIRPLRIYSHLCNLFISFTSFPFKQKKGTFDSHGEIKVVISAVHVRQKTTAKESRMSKGIHRSAHLSNFLPSKCTLYL